MFLYDTYEDENERQLVLAMESAEISLDRALLSYNALVNARDLNIKQAEIAFVESGSDDVNDLMDFYEKADEQTEEKQKGLLATIWDKIRNFVSKIIDVITGRKKKPDQNYVVTSNFKKFCNNLKELGKSVLEFLTNPIKAVFTKGASIWKKLLGVLEGIALGVAVYKGGKWVIAKATSKKNGNGEEVTEEDNSQQVEEVSGEELNKQSEELKGILDQIKSKLPAGVQDFINKKLGKEEAGEAGSLISKVVKPFKKAIDLIRRAPSANQTTTEGDTQEQKEAGKAADNSGDKAGDTGSTGDNTNNNGGNNQNNNNGQETTESGPDDFDMTTDFANLLAEEQFEESAGVEEFSELLGTLI